MTKKNQQHGKNINIEPLQIQHGTYNDQLETLENTITESNNFNIPNLIITWIIRFKKN